jgi:hypothetical protein
MNGDRANSGACARTIQLRPLRRGYPHAPGNSLGTSPRVIHPHLKLFGPFPVLIRETRERRTFFFE